MSTNSSDSFFSPQLHPDQVGYNLLKKGIFCSWCCTEQAQSKNFACQMLLPGSVPVVWMGDTRVGHAQPVSSAPLPSWSHHRMQKSHNGLCCESRWYLSPQGPGEQRMSTDRPGALGCWDCQEKLPGEKLHGHILCHEMVGPGQIPVSQNC